MRTSRPPSPPPPPPKETPFGPYRLLERIAVGGMAEVFRAEEPRSVGAPRIVVVKRMLPTLADDENARAMFKEEAWLSAQIQHPNVVELLKEGEAEGRPYIAMEYVRGLNLSQVMNYLRAETVEPGVALTVYLLRELLKGLHAVHEARGPEGEALSIVHHDISPSNVLLSVHGEVKLGDFGIARTKMRKAFPQAPLNESARGKLGYMAPEQVTGQAADRRCDVFGAGVIAAELLMSKPLFSGGTELAILLAIRDAHIEPFLQMAPRLPAGLADVIAAALRKSARDRTPSAQAFCDALAPFQTASDDALREAMAELVMDARASRDSRITIDVPTPPAPTSPESPVFAETTPMAFELETGRQVHEVPVVRYRVRTQDGRQFGPWNYAEMVEAVATGRISPSDAVDLGRGSYRAIRDVPDLARHIARHLPETGDHRGPITKRVTNQTEPSEKGLLSDGGIMKTLAVAAFEQRSGLLLCELGTVRKEVYLKRGAPEYVSSNLAGELLGEYLVTKSIITRGELDMALAVMPRFEGRLGETLTALGLVEPVQLFQHIAEQVREKLLDLFSWESGTWAYYPGVNPPPSGFPLGLDPWAILLEGIARRFELGLETDVFRQHPDVVLVPNDAVLSRLGEAAVPHHIQLVLHALDHPQTAGEIVHTIRRYSGEQPIDASHMLLLLQHLGGITWQM